MSTVVYHDVGSYCTVLHYKMILPHCFWLSTYLMYLMCLKCSRVPCLIPKPMSSSSGGHLWLFLIGLALLPFRIAWHNLDLLYAVQSHYALSLLKQYYWLHSETATPAHLLCSGRVRKVVVQSQEVLCYVSRKVLYIYTNSVMWHHMCDSVTVWHNTYSTVRMITNSSLHYIWDEVPATCTHSIDRSRQVHMQLQHSPSLCCT